MLESYAWLEMLPRAIFFDLDDTIIDHRNASISALEGLRRNSPVLGALELDALEKLWRMDFDKYWQMLLRGDMTIGDNRAIRLGNIFRSLGEEPRKNELQRLSELYGEDYIRSCSLIEGAVEMLSTARDAGMKVGAISNNISWMQNAKMSRLGIMPYFDSVILSGDHMVRKPDREIFSIALNSLGSIPGESIMVGDSLEQDVIGAKTVGMGAVWFNRSGSPMPDGVDGVTTIDRYIPLEDAWKKILSSLEP